MITKEEIIEILKGVTHPETGQNIVEGGILQDVEIGMEGIVITLNFRRKRDPFAKSVATRAKIAVDAACDLEVQVVSKEGEDAPKPRQHEGVAKVKNIIAVASGKGGVGKSTVTANIAVELHKLGYSVGVLDADIYGPSQSKMFGVEDYLPDAIQVDGRDYIVPAEVEGIKLISIAMFIRKTDALLWRGTMANSALRQLIHQSEWGYLDFLLIDLPPGTGDIHLSIINELRIGGAIIVSTPQQVAVADVVRGVEMFRNPNVNIPVLGVVENMAWFTPAELPNNRYYIFGKGGAARYAEEVGVDLLGEVPIIQDIMQGADDGTPAVNTHPQVAEIYRQVAQKVVDKMGK